MCGVFLSGVWWVFPLVGIVICAGMMLVAFRFGRTGHGCMCMGDSRSTKNAAAQPVPGVNPASR